jgi:hypothetical protein
LLRKAVQAFTLAADFAQAIEARNRAQSIEIEFGLSEPSPEQTTPQDYTPEQRTAECAIKLQRLKPHSISDQWLQDQMKRGAVECNPDGTPAVSLRDALRQKLYGSSQRPDE